MKIDLIILPFPLGRLYIFRLANSVNLAFSPIQKRHTFILIKESSDLIARAKSAELKHIASNKNQSYVSTTNAI